MNIIVFSKNRALQLDLFLRSFLKYVKNSDIYKINVLYTSTNSFFENGYNKIKNKYHNINLIKETNFKKDLLTLINKKNQYIVFFVDDDIFKNNIDFYDDQEKFFKENNDILCRSLRLHPKLKKCYPANLIYTKIPDFIKISNNSFKFKWKNYQGDYGYPMSLDGHIFRTIELLPLLKNRYYTNPNSLEGVLFIQPLNNSYMLCYDKSIIINNPCNIVQTNNPNIHGNEDIVKLNQKYLDEFEISFDNIDNIDNISCHQEIEIILKKNK